MLAYCVYPHSLYSRGSMGLFFKQGSLYRRVSETCRILPPSPLIDLGRVARDTRFYYKSWPISEEEEKHFSRSPLSGRPSGWTVIRRHLIFWVFAWRSFGDSEDDRSRHCWCTTSLPTCWLVGVGNTKSGFIRPGGYCQPGRGWLLKTYEVSRFFVPFVGVKTTGGLPQPLCNP